jgi:peptidoglycan hydrolase-like protein with peptidoglycan-binding domain
MVKLDSISYSNVKVDNDSTRSDSINKNILDDLQKAGEATGIIITITTAVTGHSKYTKSGTISRHGAGAAVDVAILNGRGSNGANSDTSGDQTFRQLGNKIKDYLVNNLGYSWNVEKGNTKAVLWQTSIGGNHYNHMHISNKSKDSSSQSNTPIASTKIKKTYTLSDLANGKILLRSGDKNDLVAAIQNKLKERGITSTGKLGEFDKAMYNAVKAFQSESGIKIDGIVGPETYSALFGKTINFNKTNKIMDTTPSTTLSNYEKMAELVINKLEGGYYHPDMLKDGRIKDKRYSASSETMFGIDRNGGSDINDSPEGKQFWKLIDSAEARKKWSWLSLGGSLEQQLRKLAAQTMKPRYDNFSKRYLSPAALSIVNKDERLLFHFIYATWNGAGWFQTFAKKINDAVSSGETDPNNLWKIAIDSRINNNARNASSKSLIAQGGQKIKSLFNNSI